MIHLKFLIFENDGMNGKKILLFRATLMIISRDFSVKQRHWIIPVIKYTC